MRFMLMLLEVNTVVLVEMAVRSKWYWGIVIGFTVVSEEKNLSSRKVPND